MVSFSAFAVLSIAVQSLFAGVDAAVLPKRQDTTTTDYSTLPDLETIIQALVSNLGGTFGTTGGLKVNATFGLGDQESSPFGAIFQQLIPSTFNGLTGPGNNVNLTGVSGQPPFSIGLGFSPANGTDSGFDFASMFSQISDPFSAILSTLLGGNNITTFPIFGGSFPGDGFPGQNSTFPNFNSTTPPFPSLPPSSPVLPLPTDTSILVEPLPTDTDTPAEPLPTDTFSEPLPTDTSIEPVPTNTDTPAKPLATDTSTPDIPLPTDIRPL